MRNSSKEATVIMARCNRTRLPFGITMEKRGGTWHQVWAFKMSEKSASVEDYGETMVQGQIVTDPEYPGCPHCGAHAWFSCSCGKLTCLSESQTTATCSWCGFTGTLQSAESFDLCGGGF